MQEFLAQELQANRSVFQRGASRGDLHMSGSAYESDLLALLENRELGAVTFVRDYVQLHFDGPVLNVYVWPKLTNSSGSFSRHTPGFRDALCDRIGRLVVAAVADGSDILLYFEDDAKITVSLRDEDLVGGEAAMLQDPASKRWNVW